MDNENLTENEQERIEALNKMEAEHKKLKKNLKGHLETFNDGVIAILITIMVLEIPIPSAEVSIQTFFEAIRIFIISFFVVAEFWYEHHRTFMTFEEATHGVVIMDFIFLVIISLIPITTKWIMHDIGHASVLTYGFVYLLSKLSELVTFYVAHRGREKRDEELYKKIMMRRFISVMALNVALIALSLFIPRIVIILYLALPILSFFFPTARLGGRRRWIRKVKN